jgi:hypothetical protein
MDEIDITKDYKEYIELMDKDGILQHKINKLLKTDIDV